MRPIIGITCTSTASSGSSPRNGIGASYISAIEHAGGTPILLPLVRKNSCIADFLSIIDGLLLPGGVDVDPFLYGEEPKPAMGGIDVGKDQVEMWLINRSLEMDLPILGICRGIQMLNVATGGTLYQDVSMSSSAILQHRQKAPGSHATHTINLREGSRLLDILGQSTFQVNSFHHQAVKEPAPGFMVSAATRDGVIEGIEDTHYSFVVGVQFHPELMWQNNPPITTLFVTFVNEAKAYKQKREALSKN